MSDPRSWTRNETPKSFFNPLSNDFEVDYRNEDNVIEHYIIPSMKIVTYPTYLADFIIKRLIDALIEDRDMGYVTDEQKHELKEEIEI